MDQNSDFDFGQQSLDREVTIKCRFKSLALAGAKVHLFLFADFK